MGEKSNLKPSSDYKEVRNIDKFRCPSCNTNCGMKWYAPRGRISGSFNTAKSGCDDAIIYLDETTGKYYSKKVIVTKEWMVAYRSLAVVEDDVVEVYKDFFKSYTKPCKNCAKRIDCPFQQIERFVCGSHRRLS